MHAATSARYQASGVRSIASASLDLEFAALVTSEGHLRAEGRQAPAFRDHTKDCDSALGA
jgi:hypothetical protein